MYKGFLLASNGTRDHNIIQPLGCHQITEDNYESNSISASMKFIVSITSSQVFAKIHSFNFYSYDSIHHFYIFVCVLCMLHPQTLALLYKVFNKSDAVEFRSFLFLSNFQEINFQSINNVIIYI